MRKPGGRPGIGLGIGPQGNLEPAGVGGTETWKPQNRGKLFLENAQFRASVVPVPYSGGFDQV